MCPMHCGSIYRDTILWHVFLKDRNDSTARIEKSIEIIDIQVFVVSAIITKFERHSFQHKWVLGQFWCMLYFYFVNWKVKIYVNIIFFFTNIPIGILFFESSWHYLFAWFSFASYEYQTVNSSPHVGQRFTKRSINIREITAGVGSKVLTRFPQRGVGGIIK